MSDSRKLIHLPNVRMLNRGGRSSRIRITNVKSIKPPDPEYVKKQEEDKLRAELQAQIAWGQRACAHKLYECPLAVAAGRAHCARHALDDAGATCQPCCHAAAGRRCARPAPADRDHALCFEHAYAALQNRQRSAAPPAPVTTTETLLNQLQHYIRPERTRTTSCASSVSVVSDPADHEPVTHAVDPFKEIEATSVNASISRAIMECAGGSDSDGETPRIADDILDVVEDEDAPCEKRPLWRAGVFTAEEAVSEAKEVLKSLQSAYIGQMGRLRICLQMARLQYVKSLRSEKETYCSINTQARSGPLTVRERRQLRKLKAYAGYHRKHGVDAVLARKLHKKRAKVNEIPSNRGNPSQGRCTFTEGGVRCPEHTLPAAKHCLKHILQDRQQVLFKPCGDPRGGVECREPVAQLPLPSNTCRYHTRPPAYTAFTLKKDESTSDEDSHSSSDTDAEGFPTPAVEPSPLPDVLSYD